MEKTQRLKQERRGGKNSVSYLTVFKQALPQLYNVFFVFFVTLSIFPAIQAGTLHHYNSCKN